MEKQIRKILIAVLAVICLACVGLAAACKDDTRYTLTYIVDECVTVESEAKSGAQIKKGSQVSFSLVIDENAEGSPIVSANGKELIADANGVYTFKMSEDTTVEVIGVYFMNVYNVEFSREYTVSDGDQEYTYTNDFIAYYDTEGKPLETLEVVSGETVSFRLNVSVYYGESPEFTVRAGSVTVKADNDGIYSFSVTGDTKVTVTGLPTDLSANSFAGREDGGKGTESEPFLIREPVDLYVMADLIEDDFYSDGRWQMAYYRLENDIDMKGEQLYVIGNTLTQVSIFMGVFDGNGHTIKNYTMSNTLIEQSEFGSVQLQQVGLFGFVADAVIYDLNLENFTIEVDAISSEDNVFAGAVAGYVRGSDIQNCSASGKIIMHGSEQTSFIGGIAGGLEAYSDETQNLPSTISSCATDVEIGVLSGAIYAAGGIAGYVYTAEERVTAAILNCYSTGDVYGAMRAGGIAGQVSSYSSIKNCYATGEIEANNDIAETTGAEDFSYAYAGGIAAYLEYGGVVSDSFFTGSVYASATESKYEVAGNVVAAYDVVENGIYVYTDRNGGKTVYTDSAVVFNCYSLADNNLTLSDGFVQNTLGWSSADWKFTGNGLPQINRESSQKTYTVTIKYGDGKIEHEFEWRIENYYASMGHWYLLHSSTLDDDTPSGIPEFIGEGMRTYGYFFDRELTQKVPYGYMPTEDITLYAELVDYGSVAGVYYLQGEDGYLELTDDGYLYYRDGALNVLSTYVYNGDYIILYNTFLAILVNEDYDFYTFKAEVNGGVISVYDNDIYLASNPLRGLMKADGFRYGSYYDAQNNEYTFNLDGTGTEKLASGETNSFTFTVSANSDGYEVRVSYGASGAGRECIVVDGEVVSFNGISVSAYDSFKGVWESKAGAVNSYTFDGKGGWTYEYYDYNARGEKVILDTRSGTYTLVGDALSFGDKSAEFTADGRFITVDGETYYKENSFAGTWTFSGRPELNEPITIEFNGIGTDGFGTARVSYLRGEELEVNYSSREAGGTVYVDLYLYYTVWGHLTYDKNNGTLTGQFYSNKQGMLINNVTFCLHDALEGTWTGEGAFTSLRFDGMGNYDINGSVNCIETKGYVYVNGERNPVRYTLNEGWLSGSFTYKSVTYTFSYDKESGNLTVSGGESDYTLTR